MRLGLAELLGDLAVRETWSSTHVLEYMHGCHAYIVDVPFFSFAAARAAHWGLGAMMLKLEDGEWCRSTDCRFPQSIRGLYIGELGGSWET